MMYGVFYSSLSSLPMGHFLFLSGVVSLELKLRIQMYNCALFISYACVVVSYTVKTYFQFASFPVSPRGAKP
jgi:hypothetical protein